MRTAEPVRTPQGKFNQYRANPPSANSRLLGRSRLISKLRERQFLRRQSKQRRILTGVRAKAKKRKIALASTASLMTLSTAAISLEDAQSQQAMMAESVVDATKKRVGVEHIRSSDQLKRSLIEEEGIRYEVYRDVAGLPTVGIGHLVTPEDRLTVGDRITRKRALALFDADMRKAERAVRQRVKDTPLYQHEFDALVDLVYNVGPGALESGKSPRLAAAIDDGNHYAMSDELAYHNAAGRVATGLVYRSERREAIFVKADYSDPRDS